MAQFYEYLISSLPMLNFQAASPFSYEKFLEACESKVSDEEFECLKSLPEAHAAGFAYSGTYKILDSFYTFETNLRNELVHARAIRHKIPAEKYLRRPQYVEPAIVHLAQAALRTGATAPLDAEKMLDRERWKYLEDLECGHYLDFDFLIIYASKLLILERWTRINNQDKHALLQQTLEGAN